MTPRKKPEELIRRPNKFATLEDILREKERVRKLKKTLSEKHLLYEQTHDGRPKTEGLDEYDPLLEVLIREHPEKDPAKIK